MGPPRKSTITFYYGPKQSKERLCVAQKPFHPVSQQMRAKYFLNQLISFSSFLPLNYYSYSEYQGVRDGDGEGSNRRYILQPLVI